MSGSMSLTKMRSARHLKYAVGGILILSFFAGWLFPGIYRDREFRDMHLFLKHRPTFKFKFYAPLGESDERLNSLSSESRYEEMMYQEYVEEGGGSQRSIPIPF